MKKLISLAALAAIMAGCTTGQNNQTATYGSDGFDEEALVAESPNQSLSDTYLMAAAPKYYIGNAYKVDDVQYIPMEDLSYNQTGIAGIVPTELNGQKTSNGEIFDSNQMVATSKTLPLPTIARVTNMDNGQSVIVRVNNRGPFVNTRIMDLSSAAASRIGINGTAKVQVQVLGDESIAVKNATIGETPKPVVTETVEVEPLSQQPAPVATTGDYSVQVASVYSEDNANALARELSPYGNATVVRENDMYKVRIIDLDAAGARRTIDALRSDKGMSPGLLKAGKWINADSI